MSGKWVYGWRARLWNESLALSFSRGLACFVSRTGGGCGLKPSALAVCAITAREAAIERVIVIALLTSPADVSLRKESDRGTGVRMSASSRVNEFRGRGGEDVWRWSRRATSQPEESAAASQAAACEHTHACTDTRTKREKWRSECRRLSSVC